MAAYAYSPPMGELAILGLRAAEEEIYRFLAGRPGCTLAEIESGVARQPGELPEILDELERKGLVTRTAEVPESFVPASPDVALGALIAERENELRTVRELASSLLEQFREVHRLVEAITGPEAVRQRAVQLQRHARHQVRILDQAPYAFEPVLDRAVACRSVCDRSYLDQPRRPAAPEEQVRIATSVPARLLLCDDRFALLPLPGDPEACSALLVNPSTLLEALSALFEVTWRRAISDFAAGEHPSPEDLRLLRLLSTGAKDEALGRRMGLSARTVHRRIQLLMARLGVSTRLQLGIEAQRRGWIGRS